MDVFASFLVSYLFLVFVFIMCHIQKCFKSCATLNVFIYWNKLYYMDVKLTAIILYNIFKYINIQLYFC